MRFQFRKIITWICFFVGFYLFIKYGYILPKFDFIINLLIVALLGLLIVLFIIITILRKFYSHQNKHYHYYGNPGFWESSSFGNTVNHDLNKKLKEHSDLKNKKLEEHSDLNDLKNKKLEEHSDLKLKYIQNDKLENYVYDEKSGIWIPHSESNSENFHHMSESEIWIPHSEDSLGNVGINKSFISSSAETNKETFNSSKGYGNIKIEHENANYRNPSIIKIEIRNFVVSVLSGIIASIFFHYLSELLNWH